MLTLLQPSFVQSRSRRKGQALILAVLVMLFAVLLSSAFLVVIGNNGRQVVRETDKLEASRNADKGVAFVIARLRAADVVNPDAWNASTDVALVGRPIAPVADPGTSGGVPAQGHANYSLYYSQLDQAMGWASQGTIAGYAKYPDPRRSRQAPQFLVSSHVMGTANQDDVDGGDKRFMLRITVIGLSSKNPEAWSKRTLYKTTNWNGGTFSYANFVTSFDPDVQKPVASTLYEAPTDPLTVNSLARIKIFAAKGQGNERVVYSPRIASSGSTLMISDGHTQPVVGIVKDATLTTGTASSYYTVRIRVLQAGAAPAFVANSKVALVGSLFELPTQVDENGDANGVPATNEGPTLPQKLVGVSAAAAPFTAPFGNGALFNNGLNVPITTTFAGRPPVAPSAGSPTVAGQNQLASTGPISIGDPTPAPVAAPATLQFNNATNTTQTIAIAQATPQAAPAQNQFLSVSYGPGNAPQVLTASSAVAPVVAPRFVKPAPLNLAIYRAKALAGGLYIPNAEDVEKFNGQPLSTGQLQRLWQRKSFVVGTGGNTAEVTAAAPVPPATTAVATGTTNARLCYGRPGIDTYSYPMASGGLEAQGIRGWISPWEFLPRGAQIILDGTTATIIRDPLSDGSPNAPDINKAVAPATLVRQFSQPLPAGFTGVIYAEGNVRVRGTWKGAPLSIVAGGNIYVEGNLQTPVINAMVSPATSKIALLSKKNVVLNPTQFIPRPYGTVDTSVGRSAVTGTYNGGNLTVSDNTKFKLDDKIAVFSETAAAFDGWRTVKGITGNVLTLDNPLSYSGNVKVKLACDPPIVLLKDNPLTRAPQNTTPNASQFAFNERIVGTVTGSEANTLELDPVTNPANVGTFYAYKFAVGGDTFARNVPFTNPNLSATNVGISFAHSAQKKILIFAVQGGNDPNANPVINDTGVRSLKIRDTAYRLTLSPKPGPATNNTPNEQVFNLEQLTGSTSDSQSTLNQLRTDIRNPAPNDTETKDNRWRLVLPAAVAPAPAGVMDNLAARRFAKVTMTASLGQNPADDPDTAETVRSKFRVPLTSSVLLFNGDLVSTAPTTLNPLLTLGSFYGFQNGALPTTPAGLTEDNRFIDPTQPFYGYTPRWSLPTGTTYAQVSTMPTNDVIAPGAGDPTAPKAKPFAFTRDGSGDYNDQLPTYYLSAMHFQRVNGSNASVAASAAEPQKTNMVVTVDATIYAEGGSWFVIPVPTPNANNATSTDAAQQIEWRRPAYKVTINGNITQMMTPSATVDYDDEPDPDGVITGAMKRWTDTLSYQVFNNADSKVYWQSINYNAAPLPAIDTTTTTGFATLPVLPSSPDILYTYSN